MTEENHAIGNAKAWLETIRDLAARMDSDDSEVSEAARDEASESALSVQVRGGWYAPGAPLDASPEEFEVLLTTGGPALRVFGRLGNYCEPDDMPALQWQDWGTPWTDYYLDGENLRAVRIFLTAFWFGE